MNPENEKILFEQLEKLNKKSEQLITLLAVKSVAEIETTKEKVIFLGKLGLDRNQIALICNTSPGSVSVELSNAKKKGLIK